MGLSVYCLPVILKVCLVVNTHVYVYTSLCLSVSTIHCEFISLIILIASVSVCPSVYSEASAVDHQLRLRRNSLLFGENKIKLCQIDETLFWSLLMLSAVHDCIFRRLVLFLLPNQSHMTPTQITCQHGMPRRVNNRSLIPPISHTYRQ